ncbi:MAG: hypothetical protein WCV56_03250 [Candidatus Omnitrophota bacterium]
MKKTAIIVIVCVMLLFVMLGLAFVYIDLTGHKSFFYDITLREEPWGAFVLDRYVTESMVIYKSRVSTPFSEGYPSSLSSLHLDRMTKMPVKYVREDLGVRGQKAVTSLVQKQDLTDYLFLENPRFIKVENFSTGEKTMVYAPQDLMLVTALMERYNYWKKGTQYLEIMMPVSASFPPLRDRVSIRYVEDEYVKIMGRKIEAEIYVIGSRAVKETKIAVSKNSHRVLEMVSPGIGTKFTLSAVNEGPAKLSMFSLRNLPFVSSVIRGIPEDKDVCTVGFPGRLRDVSAEKVLVPGKVGSKEVFFESGNVILSGKIWEPEGDGPFPGVLIVPGEGPEKTGEKLFKDYLAGSLVRSGYLVMSFDSPGQGKSQGSFYEMDDEMKTRNILSAFRTLSGDKKFLAGTGVIVARGTSGNAVLRAVALEEKPIPCILVLPRHGAFPEKKRLDFSKDDAKDILGPFWTEGWDVGFLSNASREAAKHFESVARSRENTAYFLSERLPIKGYRDYIDRSPHQLMLSVNVPLLIIFDRDDPLFDKRVSDALRQALSLKTEGSEVIVLEGLGQYGGSIDFADGKWRYAPKEELFIALKDWMDKVRIIADSHVEENKGIQAIHAEKLN